MNPISIVLVIVVAFLAGMEGILDEWEFHQPIVACTLIGLVCGHPTEGIILGTCAKMFTIAGPVLVFGTLASVVYGLILMIFGLA